MADDPKRRARDTAGGAPSEKRDDPHGRARWFRHSRQRADGKLAGGLIGRASALKRRRERELWTRRTTRFEPAPAVPGGPAPVPQGGPSGLPPATPGGPGSVNWTFLGPDGIAHGMGGSGNPIVSGRITALAVGPKGQRVYAGSANGGVWFSGDGGDSWKPLDQFAVSPTPPSAQAKGLEADVLSVGAIAVRFGAQDTVYVGTGEPNNNLDGYFGIGIKVSTDSGDNFTLEGTNLAGSEVHQIVIDPVDPGIVFTATTTGIYRRPAGPDFGTWPKVPDPSGSGKEVTDLAVGGSGASRVYYAASGDQVYQSSDIFTKDPGNVTWAPVWGLTHKGRKALAVGEDNKSVVYCLAGNTTDDHGNPVDATLYRLDNGTGGDFRKVDGVPKALFAGGQSFYDIGIAADPSDANTVYLLGDLTSDSGWALSLFRGKIVVGSDTFTFPFNSANASDVTGDPTWIGRGIHPDGHALAFATNADGTHDGSVVWVGCDGGVFRSLSSGSRGSFDPKNKGLGITQFNYISVLPDAPDKMYGGSQDNGTLRYTAGDTPPWYESGMGDGGGVAINPRNPSQIIRQYIYASLEMSSNDGAEANWPSAGLPIPITDPRTGEDVQTAFYAPVVALATADKTLVAFGTNRLWFRTDWSDPWSTLPTGTDPYQASPPNLTQDVLDASARVTAIAFGSSGMILVATSGPGATGKVWLFEQSGGKWTVNPLPAISSPPAPSFIYVTDLTIENGSKPYSFYASLGSYGQWGGGGGGKHVLYYDGTNWQNADPHDGIPDVPAHAVVVDPADKSTIFLGTDVGVWKGAKKSGSDWTWDPFSPGLPESAVTDLAVLGSSRKLRAATHGRGIWEIALGPAATSSSSSTDSSSSSADSSSSSADSGSSSSSADSSSSSSADSSSSSSADSSSSSVDSSSSSSADSSSSSSVDSSSSSSEDSSSSSADSSSSSSADSSSSSSEDSSSSSADSSSSSDDSSSSSSDDSSSSSDSGRAAPRAPQAAAKGGRTETRTARRKSK